MRPGGNSLNYFSKNQLNKFSAV